MSCLPRRPERSAVFLLLLLITASGCNSSKPNTHSADGKVDAVRVYGLYCTGCHGEDGKRGKGDMILANGQRPDPAEIRTVIEDGRKEMPAWKQRLTPAEISAIVEYVRTLEASAQTH
jgi:mono/diheme cytochrome c family protein